MTEDENGRNKGCQSGPLSCLRSPICVGRFEWQLQKSERLRQLPPYLFAEIDRLKAELIAKGVDVINLGVGDPDLPTPSHIIERLGANGQRPG